MIRGVSRSLDRRAYAKFGVRGYGVVEARPDALRARFKAVDTVLRPGSRAYDLARFTVARDDPRAQPG
jgi:hypothetical protein